MKQKIVIAIPTYDSRCSAELMEFFIESGKSYYTIIPMVIAHLPTPVARNQAVARAMHTKSNLIFVDADAIPPKGAFETIADKICQEECVAALPYLSSGGSICVGENSPTIKETEGLEGWTKVDNCGTHVIGYNVKVFSKITPPYYYYDYNIDHTMMVGYLEDTSCHRRLREAGVPIYVNYSLWASHVVSRTLEKPRVLSPMEKAMFLSSECEATCN